MLGDDPGMTLRALALRHLPTLAVPVSPQQAVGHHRYLETVMKLLSRVPRWLSVSLALVSAGALYALARFSASLHGWELALSLAMGIVFTTSAVGLPLLDRWQSQQEARLKVDLELEPQELTIPAYADDEKVIESLLAAEEIACMASLLRNPPERPERRRGFNAAVVAEEGEGDKTGSGYSVKAKGLTVRDYQRLLDKKDSGAELTPEEEQEVEAIQKVMSSVVSGFSGLNANAFSSPERRTPEEYREVVQQHLSDYRDFLSKHLQWEYVSRGIGRLRLTLVNPTDRVFEDVEVEIYLPGRIAALYPRRLSQPASSKPARPRPFGTRTSLFGFSNDSFIPRSVVISNSANSVPPPAPKIDNSASAKVTYPSVMLRPRARVDFDDIVLIVNEAPGSVIAGTWEASATNAQARVKGNLTVRIATTPLPVREILDRLSATEGAETDSE
jgi:hypothetical protein